MKSAITAILEETGCTHVEEVTHIALVHRGLVDLQALSSFKNLIEVDVTGNQILSLFPLRQLKLEQLVLD